MPRPPLAPPQPGCYYLQATSGNGRPGCLAGSPSWNFDAWGLQNGAFASKSACLARRAGHDGHCDTNTQWLYVPGPGCYYLQTMDGNGNTGCLGGSTSWNFDAWGLQNGAFASESACLARRAGHDGHCDTNTQWLHVPGPGCYYLQTMDGNGNAGCLGGSPSWNLDTWGQ